MATAEQMNELMGQNAEFIINLQSQTAEHIKNLPKQLMFEFNGGGEPRR